MALNLALFIALVVLQVLDYYTTTTILTLGGEELNPVMRWLMQRVGVEEALVVKGGFVILIGGAFYDNIAMLGVLVAACVVVVAFNFRSMPK